jgi:hypothetical protein
MNLKICPECDRIINVDNLENGDPNSVIGCGLKEEIQNRLTKITAKEYYEVKICI